MKRNKILLVGLCLMVVGCAKKIDVNKIINNSQNTGELSAFALEDPLNGAVVESVDEFRWAVCENAEKYTLEVCSSNTFVSNVDTVDYYKRENITTNSFKFGVNFAYRDVFYYWRVTAYNSNPDEKKNFRVCTSEFRFYVKAPSVEEFQFDLGEADDWSLHPLGSYADVGIDNSNFFGTNEKSLKISFKEEDTNHGSEESKGWIVVARSVEKSIYGTDALYFNCFYAGDQSNIIIRLLDRDNEYWCCPIQTSVNAKQSVILKFSDFYQRTTADVIVANRTFDFERIKYLEVVFEQTFGDGVFLMSGMKAIKFSNYRNLFIDKLNFNEYGESKYTYENYVFEHEALADNELKLNYYGTVEGKEKINGYGFAKINVNRYFATGDSIKMKVKYTGVKGSNVILRVYEEDTDRWSFKIPFSKLTEGEYKELILPYSSFAKSQVMGDGRRQFYFILNLQFGLEGQYGTGSIFFKDFEIVSKKNYSDETYRSVGASGLVENFDNYTFNSEIYFIWNQSEQNKDEFMDLNTVSRVGNNNVQCGQFEYKTDMAEAQYYLPVRIQEGLTFTSLSLWLKDASIKSTDGRASAVTEFNPDFGVYLALATGELYGYILQSLSTTWYQYDIPFENFTLMNEESLGGRDPQPITNAGIAYIGFTISYRYSVPLYAPWNPVLIDNIYFSNVGDFTKIAKQRIVSRDADDLAYIDTFEGYDNPEKALDFWLDGRDYDYQHREMSTDVSSEGGANSLALQYKTKNESPSYVVSPSLHTSVTDSDLDPKFRSLKIHLKSDKAATVYLNLYNRVDGKDVQYRATINNVGTVWTEYILGFEKFGKIVNNAVSFETTYLQKDLQYLSRVTIGVVYNSGENEELATLYVDNVAFDATHGYTADIKRVI